MGLFEGTRWKPSTNLDIILKGSAEVSFLPFAKDILSPDCVEAAVVRNMDKHLEQHLEFVSSSKQEA